MKVLDESNVKWDKVQFPLALSIKLDGVYCYSTYDPDKDEVALLSRTNKPIVCEHLLSELREVHKSANIPILIGELMVQGKDFDYISGLVRKKEQTKAKEEIQMFIHDCVIPLNFRDRFIALTKEIAPINRMGGKYKYLILVGEKLVFNRMEVYYHFNSLVNETKEEGIVLRNIFAYYQEGKRNQDMFKLKRKCSFTLQIKDYFLGKKGSKYEDTIGGLIVIDYDGTEVKVGSGLTDADRAHMLSNFEEYRNTYIEVEAMGVTSQGNLRMPRIKGFRDDKLVADKIKI